MKIATNVCRDAFGGITISNLALFDWLEDKEDTIVGIEVITERHILGAVIFRRYLPSFFSHHIINAIDIFSKYSWEKVSNLEKKWRILIDTTKNVLRRESPDILLINGTYYTPWILAQAAKELGIPVVLRYAGILQREVVHKNFFVRKKLLKYERWLALSAKAIIFPSEICKKVVEEEIVGKRLRNSFVVPNPAQLRSTSLRPKTKKRYVMATVGRWTKIKNFESFISIHNQLMREEWPHKAIMVTSFFDKNFGFPETIDMRKSMSHDELLKFYKSIDLLVVTSHFETFCNVAAEAVVSGTSVLVSKNVGFSEILIRAGLGRMVVESFDDNKKVIRAIKNIAGNPITKKEVLKVASLINPQKVHQEIMDILEGVVKVG